MLSILGDLHQELKMILLAMLIIQVKGSYDNSKSIKLLQFYKNVKWNMDFVNNLRFFLKIF